METLWLTEKTSSRLYLIGSVATILQLVMIILYMVVTLMVGPRITHAEDFFIAQHASLWSSLLRIDLMMMLLVGLYLGSFPALLVSLWRTRPLTTSFAFGFTLIGVVLSFAGESTFAMVHLGKEYISAASEVERAQLVTAGQAILAGGWWNSTGSYVTGFLLQTGGIMISVAMLHSPHFRKMTAFAGILGNSFDLVQHLVSPFFPEITLYLSFGMVAYLVWYPLLALDLYQLSKRAAPGGVNLGAKGSIS